MPSSTVSVFGDIVYATPATASAASLTVTLPVVASASDEVASYVTGVPASRAITSRAVPSSCGTFVLSGAVTAKLSSASRPASSLSSRYSVISRAPVNAAVAEVAVVSYVTRSLSVVCLLPPASTKAASAR